MRQHRFVLVDGRGVGERSAGDELALPFTRRLENLADGMSLDDILDAYPGLPRASANAAIELAATAIEQVEQIPQRLSRVHDKAAAPRRGRAETSCGPA